MRKLLVGLLAVGCVITLGVAGLAARNGGVGPGADSAESRVTWTQVGFIELTVSSSAFDFGTLAAGQDEAKAEDAVTLKVSSNLDWVLSVAQQGEAADHLGVFLSRSSGSGDATVSVDYQLTDLRSLPPGDYQVTVIYTATAR
ncbi:MAG: hypothetical protein ACP5G2_03145 [Candidatus Bipolaricaulaceae bacterium]